MPIFLSPGALSVMSDEPMFTAELVITATAHATHPDGAVVPPPIPAEPADPDKE